MGSVEAVHPSGRRPARYTAAQMRVVEAALRLFAERGVGGTSLQMMADAIGVTKAAVYHQFKTKEEIVLAAADVMMAPLEAAVTAAEAERSATSARETLLARMVDVAVERRRVVSVLQRDPIMVRLIDEHQPFRKVMQRLYRVLMGDRPRPAARVQAAMLSAAVAGAVIHPLALDLDDEALRAELLRQARAFLGLPDA